MQRPTGFHRAVGCLAAIGSLLTASLAATTIVAATEALPATEAQPAAEALPAAGTQPAASSQTGSSSPGEDWRIRDDSVGAAPAMLVGEALGREPAGRSSLSSTSGLRITTVTEGADKPLFHTAEASGTADAVELIRTAQADRRTIAVEVDTKVSVVDDVTETLTTNDPYAGSLWGIDRLDAQTAGSLPGVDGGAGVKIAVLDTGVAVHQDLAGSVLPGLDATDAGGDGRNDGYGHGTHVAGTIAATAGNSVGVAGVAPNASIIPVKVLDDDGVGWWSDVAEGITWAADNGADILNLSLGGEPSEAAQTAIEYAVGKGVLPVAAAGNARDLDSPTCYPAAYDGVIAVAATLSNDSYAPFSNAGSYVDVAAPGVVILSTYPGDSYVPMSGTSMATPHVSGAAALALAKLRSIGSAASLETLLTGTASDLGPAGWDPDYGFGMVNPVAAILSLDGPLPSPPPAPTGVQITDVTTTSAVVSWQSDGDPVQFVARTTPLSFTCEAVGTMRSCVLTELESAADYSVRVVANGLGTSSPPSQAVVFRTEARIDGASDDWYSPTPVPSNEVDEPIDTATDEDWWTFASPADGEVSVRLSNLPHDYGIYVLSEDGSEFFGYGHDQGTADELVTLPAAAAGDYLVGVISESGESDPSLNYRLTITTPQETPVPIVSPAPTAPAAPAAPTVAPLPPATQVPPPVPAPSLKPATPPVKTVTRRVKLRHATTLPRTNRGAKLKWASTRPGVCKRQGRVIRAVRTGTCVATGRVTVVDGRHRSTKLRLRVTIRVVR